MIAATDEHGNVNNTLVIEHSTSQANNRESIPAAEPGRLESRIEQIVSDDNDVQWKRPELHQVSPEAQAAEPLSDQPADEAVTKSSPQEVVSHNLPTPPLSEGEEVGESGDLFQGVTGLETEIRDLVQKTGEHFEVKSSTDVSDSWKIPGWVLHLLVIACPGCSPFLVNSTHFWSWIWYPLSGRRLTGSSWALVALSIVTVPIIAWTIHRCV